MKGSKQGSVPNHLNKANLDSLKIDRIHKNIKINK